MSAGFSQRQLKKLASPLDEARVQTRLQEGRSLSYVEGWFVLQEANRIFGYDGWDREMVHCEKLFERKAIDAISCGYAARVRISVRANGTTILREGTGVGQATAPTLGDAHDRALKAAETDATKRALVTFGGRFGLLLYDKEQRPRSHAERPAAGPSNPEPRAHLAQKLNPREPSPLPHLRASYWLTASDGSSSEVHSAESFCSGLRQLIEAAKSPAELARLRWLNTPTLTRLRQLPTLVAASGRHYADILERLMATHATEFATASEQAEERAEMTKPSPGSGVLAERLASSRLTSDATALPAELEAAIAAAVPIEEAHEAAPKLYEPFVPAPAYPLASMAERLLTARHASESASTAPSQAPTLPASDKIANERAARPKEAPAGPTRRSQITSGFAIDKSALLIPSERRLRSKAHLQFVASKPCLICEALPCHAHHITFAQPRGLSQKVSDEFTVPLCAVHHNELHAFGNEASWWREKRVEPLPMASELWRQSLLDLTPNSSE